MGIQRLTALLVALLALPAAAAEVIWKDTGVWRWDCSQCGAFTYLQVEEDDGTLHAVQTPEIRLQPRDRTATTPMRVRVRSCAGDRCAPPSEWSEPVLGVPVGFNPDWDGNGLILPSDFELGFERAFQEGWSWPVRP